MQRHFYDIALQLRNYAATNMTSWRAYLRHLAIWSTKSRISLRKPQHGIVTLTAVWVVTGACFALSGVDVITGCMLLLKRGGACRWCVLVGHTLPANCLAAETPASYATWHCSDDVGATSLLLLSTLFTSDAIGEIDKSRFIGGDPQSITKRLESIDSSSSIGSTLLKQRANIFAMLALRCVWFNTAESSTIQLYTFVSKYL